MQIVRPEFFYQLIYGNFFSDLGSGMKTGHFKSFFLLSPEKNSKTSKVNQQIVLNL